MTDYFVDLSADNGLDFNSSSIDHVGYDRETGSLYIEFTSSGNVYRYDNVAESTYNLFVTSPSLGRFYNDHITGKYTSENLGSEGYIEPREDEDLSPQGDKKWLSADGDESPFGDAGTEGTYGVRWNCTNAAHVGLPSGDMEPTFTAKSEGDAIAQFTEQVASTGKILGAEIEFKIKAVTHYFD